ncbi:hypothetical protein [Tardisphaera saccharovorans]
MKTSRPAQSTVVGAMFFIILLFFSLGIFYYLEQNYVEYGNAMQSALQLAQERNNQRFALSEAYVYPAKNGFATLFYVRNEGGVPIDLVNAYLYDETTSSASRYKVNIFVNPGQSLWVNLTKYNSSFPAVLNGYYNVSLWTSLGVGASTLVVATSNGVLSSSSPEGNVFPVPGSTSIIVGNAASVGQSSNNLFLKWKFRFWSPGEFAVANFTMSFLVVNNNPYPITIYPNTSVELDWIPTPEQLHELAVEMSAQGQTTFSGTTGAALPINKTILIPPDSVKKINVTGYNVMFYSLNWYFSFFVPGLKNISSSETSSIFNQNFDQLYVPIYPFAATNYLFAGRVLLSYFLLGKTYNMYLNNGYFNLTVYAPPSYATLAINIINNNNYNNGITYSYSTTPGVTESGTITSNQELRIPIGVPISLGAEPEIGIIRANYNKPAATAFYGWSLNEPLGAQPYFLSSQTSINTTLTVYGSNNVLQATFSSPAFYLTSNVSITISPGGSAVARLAIVPNAFALINNVTFSVPSWPNQTAGIGLKFSPSVVSLSNGQPNTVISVNIAKAVVPGTYKVYIEAVASGNFIGQNAFATSASEIWVLYVNVIGG